MTYTIVFTQPAQDAALETASYLREEASPEVANTWLDGIIETIYSLTEHPHRCGYARENADHEAELRQILYKSHRVIYTVEQQSVVVLYIRHQRQDQLRET